MQDDIKLLPLPEWMSRYTIPTDSFDCGDQVVLADRMHDYARANVAVATTALQAEIERLREQLRLVLRDAAPAVQGEPVAYISQEDFEFIRSDDMSEQYGTRQAPVFSRKDYRVSVPLYASPQPPAPDVEALAEALECMIIGACAVAVPHNGERAVLQDAVNIARAAIAAYRKGGKQ